MAEQCLVCDYDLLEPSNKQSGITTYNCPNCGKFVLEKPNPFLLKAQKKENPKAAAILSYSIRKMQIPDRLPGIDALRIKDILKNTKLPTPAEQADNLILWLGDNTEDPGGEKAISAKKHQAIIGAISHANVEYVLKSLFEEGLLEKVRAKDQVTWAKLSFRGWKRYEELKRSISDSRKAFMAMKFGDPELDSIVDDHFKPAAEKTGYDLYRLTERPRAGLIDDRMRVEIRTSRFLIADLSHGNQGAYWEAGYAEGLGKPVIYTCKKEIFDDSEEKPHFDANHHLTIIWDPTKPGVAAEELKATIRATLPDEAKLEDD